MDDFRGWQTNLRWGGPTDDVERLATSMGDEWIEDADAIAEYRMRNQYIRSAAEHLAERERQRVESFAWRYEARTASAQIQQQQQ